MNRDFAFTIKSSSFDEDYNPSESTRITTNFANLARGENRRENLRNTLVMINNRFNSLAHWDNPKADRYSVELDIISVEMRVEDQGASFPVIEILKTNIIDKKRKSELRASSGTTSRLTCAIMTLASCCRRTIKTRRNSLSRMISAICTAISLSTSSIQTNTMRISANRR